MSQSINLVPQEEKKEQRKEQLVKFSSVVSVLLLLLVSGISGYFWYQKNTVNKAIAAAEVRIAKSRTDITALSDIEVVARELDAKYKILDEFFGSKRRYSILLDELNKRIPLGNVFVDTFAITGANKEVLNISGSGLDYIAIARFIDTLSDKEYEGATQGFEGMFNNVTLNSVTLDNQGSAVNYFIVTNYDTNLLN